MTMIPHRPLTGPLAELEKTAEGIENAGLRLHKRTLECSGTIGDLAPEIRRCRDTLATQLDRLTQHLRST